MELGLCGEEGRGETERVRVVCVEGGEEDVRVVCVSKEGRHEGLGPMEANMSKGVQPDLFKSDAEQGQNVKKSKTRLVQNSPPSPSGQATPLGPHPSGWPPWAATSLGLPPFRPPPSPLSPWTPFSFDGDRLTRCSERSRKVQFRTWERHQTDFHRSHPSGPSPLWLATLGGHLFGTPTLQTPSLSTLSVDPTALVT